MWLAPTTTVTSLLLQRFNKSVSSKSCRAALLLIHQTSFFIDHLHTTTTFNSSSKFGGGTFILHQQANNLHTTTTSSPSKFGTIILQINEPFVGPYGKKKEEIKMFMLSSGSGDGTGTGTGEEYKDDDDDDDQNKKKKKKKKKMVFKLDEDLGFSALYKDFQLQDSLRMVGSCNGIICLHDPKIRWPLPMRNVYLWNPATRHFRILPESIHIERENPLKDFVGFGFDVETQDYKVVRISPFVPSSYRGDGCMCRVQVYCLSTDSWRLLDGIDSLPVSPTQDLFQNRQGTYLNGSCFFLGTKPIDDDGIRDLMLLSFDFTKEIFTIRELPGVYHHKLGLSGDLGEEEIDIRDVLRCVKYKLVLSNLDEEDFEIRGALSYLVGQRGCFRRTPFVFRTPRIEFAGGYVFTTDLIDLDFKECDYWYSMWVLDEQYDSGRVVVYKKEPWTKLHEFRIKVKGKHLYAGPRCVSNDGEFALISTLTDDNGRKKKLMLFNLVTNKATKYFTIDDGDCRAAYVYKESQVSIMGGGNALLRWQLPTHGTTYKLNLDAHYTDTDLIFGIGLCLTSDTGGCIGVRSRKTYVSDPEEGEAEAMFEAIKWAIELKLSPIIIESDSEYCVSFFMGDVIVDDSNSTYWSSREASLLREAECLLKSSENSISFQYCSSSFNYVADIASKLGRDQNTWSCKDWTATFPGEVVMSLSNDLGLET